MDRPSLYMMPNE